MVFSENDTGSGSKLYAARSKEMKSDESIEMLGIDPKWPYVNRPGCVFCFTKSFYDSISSKWDQSKRISETVVVLRHSEKSLCSS